MPINAQKYQGFRGDYGGGAKGFDESLHCLWGLQSKSWNYGHNKMSITRKISEILLDGTSKSNAHGRLSIFQRLQLYHEGTLSQLII